MEGNWKCAQADDCEERHTIVRLAPEEECSDQPVTEGKNTRDNDDVGSKEVSGKAELVKPSHVAGCQLPTHTACSGCVHAEQVERRKVRRDASDKESHGQSTQAERHEPHKNKPAPRQAGISATECGSRLGCLC